jgi:uncharacterized protein YodC (DUF2158 family)
LDNFGNDQKEASNFRLIGNCMRLRAGNLVRHKSGGPIMVIDMVLPEGVRVLDPDVPYGCSWTEDRGQKSAVFRASHLQAVYADGSPRNYDDE